MTPAADPDPPRSVQVVRPQPPESRHTGGPRLRAAGLQRGARALRHAADHAPLPATGTPVVIADYGAATGHNSLLAVGAALDVLRRRAGPEQAILVAHTDSPANDFTAMFATVAEDPDSYLVGRDAVFPVAVGRSFFGQILPSNSVHLGWSAWAVHWLGERLRPVPDHLHVGHSTDTAVRDLYARQAARDWHEFVAFRGRELATDARLVVLTMATGSAGGVGFEPLLTALADALDELVDDGRLGPDERSAMTIPTVARDEAALRAPFAPSGRFEDLHIETLEIFDAGDKLHERLTAGGSAEQFGREWAAFARTSVIPSLLAGLAGGRRDPRATAFVAEVERGVAQRMSADPQRVEVPQALVVLHKLRRLP